jgi:serine/threonine-protein kinase HipA
VGQNKPPKWAKPTCQKHAILLLTYALRNADCHSKNLALLYTSRADAHLAPAYDILTTSVYAGYQYNPPGIGFMGKKTWLPGKNLAKFLTATFGISQREQKEIVERISDAAADTAPSVCETINRLPDFKDTGKRMLATWSEGINMLRETRVYGLGPWPSPEAFQTFSDPPKLENPRRVIGQSPLLAKRSRDAKKSK